MTDIETSESAFIVADNALKCPSHGFLGMKVAYSLTYSKKMPQKAHEFWIYIIFHLTDGNRIHAPSDERTLFRKF